MADRRVRNPRAEATERLGDGRIGLVLEPSRPAVNEGPWFADEPLLVDGDSDALVISPVTDGAGSWTDAVRDDPLLADFARERWLANLKPLGEPPATLAETRASLTSLAFYVLAPARQEVNGKIGLRWTKGGFGTPYFGADRQVRVEGDLLVVQDGDSVVAEPITTLSAAGKLVGVTPGAPSGITFHDAPPEVGIDESLPVDPTAVAFLDDWFGFATLLLERLLIIEGSPDDTRVQIWPEHFDPAIELGDARLDARASYGASPGDASIPAPYLYVSPWSAQEGEFWDAPFGGAALRFADLRAATDPVEAALAFFREARRLLDR